MIFIYFFIIIKEQTEGIGMPSEHTVGSSETLESCILSQFISATIRTSYRPVLSSCVLLPPAVRLGHP